MARLDVQALRNVRKSRALQRAEHVSALRRYHHHKSFYDSGLETREDKELLALTHPVLAAELFYHRYDSELGELLVKNYRVHPQAELRVLAEAVRGVLRARQELEKRIDVVLGMQLVHVTDEQDLEEEPYELRVQEDEPEQRAYFRLEERNERT